MMVGWLGFWHDEPFRCLKNLPAMVSYRSRGLYVRVGYFMETEKKMRKMNWQSNGEVEFVIEITFAYVTFIR